MALLPAGRAVFSCYQTLPAGLIIAVDISDRWRCERSRTSARARAVTIGSIWDGCSLSASTVPGSPQHLLAVERWTEAMVDLGDCSSVVRTKWAIRRAAIRCFLLLARFHSFHHIYMLSGRTVDTFLYALLVAAD
jgi:hypothetical protein